MKQWLLKFKSTILKWTYNIGIDRLLHILVFMVLAIIGTDLLLLFGLNLAKSAIIIFSLSWVGEILSECFVDDHFDGKDFLYSEAGAVGGILAVIITYWVA